MSSVTRVAARIGRPDGVATRRVDGPRDLGPFDERVAGGAPTIVDTRTGESVEAPWDDSCRAVGLSPDGDSIAVSTLAPMDPEDTPPVTSLWGLSIVELDSGDARPGSRRASTSTGFVRPVGVLDELVSDGSSVVMGVASSSRFFHMIVSIDSGDATLISNGTVGPAPLSLTALGL